MGPNMMSICFFANREGHTIVGTGPDIARLIPIVCPTSENTKFTIIDESSKLPLFRWTQGLTDANISPLLVRDTKWDKVVARYKNSNPLQRCFLGPLSQV